MMVQIQAVCPEYCGNELLAFVLNHTQQNRIQDPSKRAECLSRVNASFGLAFAVHHSR